MNKTLLALALVLLAAHAALAKTVVYFTTMDGSQQNPPINSSYIGAAYVIVDDVTGVVTTTFTSSIPAITAAHIHKGAIGTNGPVLIAIVTAPTTSPSSQAITPNVSADALAAIASGNAYVNVHTTANPNGEIRGQLLPQNSLDTASTAFANTFAGVLTGQAEVPPVQTQNVGYGFARHDPTAKKLAVFIETTIQNITASHIHGPANTTANGPVLVALSGPVTGGVINTTVDTTPELVSAIASGQAYFNVHTAANPGGEIRAQIAPLALLLGLSNGTTVPTSTATAAATTTAAPTTTSKPAAAGKNGASVLVAAGVAAAMIALA